MAIKTLRDYIWNECDEPLVFQSCVAITSSQDKYYVLPPSHRPPKSVLYNGDVKGYFEPVPMQTPKSDWQGKGGVGVPIRQHLDDKVYVNGKK